MADDARICVFGVHLSDSNRCSVVIMNSNREEEVIADTEYRDYGAVACLNGEFILCLYRDPTGHNFLVNAR